ncbi:hypothetical protein [Dyella sp.]|uniref:hypothetical protein n=1 Tax=Dyella sp. TaxID=1869338 RepID=UPI002ED0BF60
MDYVAALFVGAFLCNALPHLAAGLMGHGFPTPFAKPHGVGFSSPAVNFVWGWANAVAGLLLIERGHIVIGLNAHFAAALLGALLLGTPMAIHFGKVQAKRSAVSA